MRVYWKGMREVQNLILSEQEGHEKVIGSFRENRRGIDAYAQTFGTNLAVLRRVSQRSKTRRTLWSPLELERFMVHERCS